MCSRYSADDEVRLKMKPTRDELRFKTLSDPEIFPNREAPIIYQENNEIIRRMMIFSLVPKIVFDAGVFKTKLSTHNARADRLDKSPLWKNSLNRRCLIPATAFYEPHRETKKWFRFELKDAEGFFLLGLWRRWEIPQKLDAYGEIEEPAKEVFGFTMITLDLEKIGGREANSMVFEIHDHMPVIVDPENQFAVKSWLWIDSDNQFPSIFLKPFLANRMKCSG